MLGWLFAALLLIVFLWLFAIGMLASVYLLLLWMVGNALARWKSWGDDP